VVAVKIIRPVGTLLSIFIAFSAVAETTLEEIVVTAQRREQSLQEVPVSVTAFTGEAIERRNIKSATDYLALTPNVSFTEDGQIAWLTFGPATIQKIFRWFSTFRILPMKSITPVRRKTSEPAVFACGHIPVPLV